MYSICESDRKKLNKFIQQIPIVLLPKPLNLIIIDYTGTIEILPDPINRIIVQYAVSPDNILNNVYLSVHAHKWYKDMLLLNEEFYVHNMMLRQACQRGKLRLVQWLFKIQNSEVISDLFTYKYVDEKSINAHVNGLDHVLLSTSIIHDQTKVINWLFNTININRYLIHWVMAELCLYGSLDQIKWFVNKVNIKSIGYTSGKRGSEYRFNITLKTLVKYAQLDGHDDIVFWLTEKFGKK